MPTTSFSVSSEGNASSATTTLNGAIKSIDVGGSNAQTNTNYTITLSQSITLNDATDADLLAINLPAGSTLTIIGGSNSLNGNGDQRGLFVYSGTVTVQNLTITNMQALGGSGGGGAGGGAGLGGGLFVASAGVVTLDNVTFSSDKATGGAGGAGSGANGLGGGGGLGGNGATGGGGAGSGGGGGGVGRGANGANSGGNGKAGIIPGAAAGGASGSSGGAGGLSGGGGGGSSQGGGGGGVRGQNSGGAGGFGGGGGGAGGAGLQGGKGGFGGGGGAASGGSGGSGGGGKGSFGGGGGSSFWGGVGSGGFGGGKAGPHGGTFTHTAGGGTHTNGHFGFGGGGGGLGAGGDVFVQQGGSLTIEGGNLSGGTVTKGLGGTGGAGAGGDGSAYGTGIFIQGNQTVTLAPATGQTLTISDVIADMHGSVSADVGAGILALNGAGTVELSAANTYTGGTTLAGGVTFDVHQSSAAGTGNITFGTGADTLQIDGTTMPTNTIATFGAVDTLDLRGLLFHTGATATLNSGTLTVVSNSVTKLLTLLNPTQTTFHAFTDGFGGTNVAFTAPSTGPTLSNVATTAAFTEESAAVTLSSAVSVTDAGSTTLASATVSITGGTFSGDGDVLAATTAGTTISASYNSATETLTLTGSDSLLHYQSVLDAVTFAAGENPTDFGSRPTRTLTWVLNDGGGSNNLSTAVTTTVSITNVNDPPTLSNVATNAAFTEEGAAVTLSSAVTVSDPDNLTLAHATISIAGGTFAGDGDVLSTNTTGTNISASYNSSTETLTLTGSDSFTHYQQVLDAVTFAAGENPTDFGSRPTRTLTWVLNDGGGSNNLSTAVTTTVSITNVNDPPTLSNVATNAAFTEEGAAVTLSSAVTVSDPDNLTLAHATISIAGGTFAGDGDVLSTNTTGTNISASYNSSTETLTLTGSDSSRITSRCSTR